MRTLHLDCRNGIAGDMTLAALVSAGADAGRVRSGIRSLGVGADVTFQAVAGGLRATVHAPEGPPFRGFHDVLSILEGGGLPRRAEARATSVFTRLAEAEAEAHGTSIHEVHFHEVGAIDSIVDVAGACLALEDLGVERVVASRVNLGSGEVRCAHGRLDVPVPAVRRLLAPVWAATFGEPTGREMTTPTGAALLVGLARADDIGTDAPPFEPGARGASVGTHDLGAPRPLVATLSR